MNTWLIARAKGADRYEDRLYFTFIWENAEILFSVGNGDEKMNCFDDKNVSFYVFLLVRSNTLSSFSHNYKRKDKSHLLLSK